MKRLLLFASLFMASTMLAGCGPHPNDITDDVAALTFLAAQA